MSKRFKTKFLIAIAQVAPNPSPTPTPTPVVIPAVPSFIITNEYPSLIKTWGNASISNINSFFNLLNSALHNTSKGKMNMKTLKNNNFSVIPIVRNEKTLFDFAKSAFYNVSNVANFLELVNKTEFSNLSTLNENVNSSLKNSLQVIFSNLKNLQSAAI